MCFTNADLLRENYVGFTKHYRAADRAQPGQPCIWWENQ
jgi:hypothetical protein